MKATGYAGAQSRRLLLAALGAVLVSGCGSPPLTPAAADEPRGYAVLVPGPEPPGAQEPQQVPPSLPRTPVEFFRGLEHECSKHLSLTWRGAANQPPAVEPERFAGVVVLRTLGGTEALLQDGRGTRLVVRGWPSYGRVLPESGREEDPMPAPYAAACPPDVFLGSR